HTRRSGSPSTKPAKELPARHACRRPFGHLIQALKHGSSPLRNVTLPVRARPLRRAPHRHGYSTLVVFRTVAACVTLKGKCPRRATRAPRELPAGEGLAWR